MNDLDRKSLARFRILVAVAKADGTFAPEEEQALKGALGSHSDILGDLLAEDIDFGAECAVLDPAERRDVYYAAYHMAYADGHAQTFEVSLLKELMPNRGEGSLAGEVLGEIGDTFLPGRILPEPDPAKRDQEILEDIIKYSALAGVAGLTPVPGVAIIADLAVVALQAKLVHDIGLYWGHDVDSKAIQGFMGAAMGSIGIRIAVANLARFVPGWGMAFAGATSFASTWAIGSAADKWFASGRALEASEISDLFKKAQAQGQKEYVAHKEAVESAKAAHGAELESLNAALAAGDIDRATYEQKVAALGD